MLEFIGFADFAKLAEIEPPLPTREGLPDSVNPFVLPCNARSPSCFLQLTNKISNHRVATNVANQEKIIDNYPIYT